MQRPYVLLIVISLCFVLGCGRGTPQAGAGNRQTNSNDLAGRLEAAKVIQSARQQDSALFDIAMDAAEAGDGDITRKAIDAIQSHNTRDAVAADAAILLANAGKSSDASTVAKLIKKARVRDSILAEIAQGD